VAAGRFQRDGVRQSRSAQVDTFMSAERDIVISADRDTMSSPVERVYSTPPGEAELEARHDIATDRGHAGGR